jgi:hypothetical protein
VRHSSLRRSMKGHSEPPCGRFASCVAGDETYVHVGADPRRLRQAS